MVQSVVIIRADGRQGFVFGRRGAAAGGVVPAVQADRAGAHAPAVPGRRCGRGEVLVPADGRKRCT